MTNLDFTPHAFITISNTGGLEIMLNRSNDKVYYRFSYGQDNIENEEIFESEIFYGYKDDDENEEDENVESLPYFIHSYDENNPTGKAENIKYFLSNAMRY